MQRIHNRPLAWRFLARTVCSRSKCFNTLDRVITKGKTMTNNDISLERVCERLNELGYGFSMQHMGGNIMYALLVLEGGDYLTITDDCDYSLYRTSVITVDGVWVDEEEPIELVSNVQEDSYIIAAARFFAELL